MFILLKYGDSGGYKKVAAIYFFFKYEIFRPVISFFYFYCFRIFNFRKSELTFDHLPLKEGISVYIPCKNEAAHLMLSLESLLGVADHFILIDNGSTDGTLEMMKQFQSDHEKEVLIEVISMPEVLLVEMVQHALSRVQHRWVLKWDGDMLAIQENLLWLKSKLQSTFRPTAFTLPRINLSGDVKHVSSLFPPVDAGEPFLRTFNNRFQFTEEFGRLEHAVIPLYYRLRRIRKRYFSFHFSDIRPPLRVMYRHCYLDWRETINNAPEALKKNFADFESFRDAWLKHNLGANDIATATFRAARLMASKIRRYDPEKFQTYPKALMDWMAEGKERFEIIYRDDQPWLMMDHEDPVQKKYQPTQEDMDWIPDASKFYNDDLRMAFARMKWRKES